MKQTTHTVINLVLSIISGLLVYSVASTVFPPQNTNNLIIAAATPDIIALCVSMVIFGILTVEFKEKVVSNP